MIMKEYVVSFKAILGSSVGGRVAKTGPNTQKSTMVDYSTTVYEFTPGDAINHAITEFIQGLTEHEADRIQAFSNISVGF